jgi:hypothetical protein
MVFGIKSKLACRKLYILDPNQSNIVENLDIVGIIFVLLSNSNVHAGVRTVVFFHVDCPNPNEKRLDPF